MVNHLKTSPLITNCNFQNLWRELKKDQPQYKNVFEISGRGALQDKQRANIEELMFDYLGAREAATVLMLAYRASPPISNGRPRYTDPNRAQTDGHQEHGERDFARPEEFEDFNLGFVPVMRVRYCAIDFARLKCGHEKWGNSCLYYREYMRTKMTFICQDSFAKFYTDQIEENNGVHSFRDRVRQFKVAPEDCKDHIGTVHNLYPLFRHMPYGLMQALHDAVEKRLIPGRSWSSIQGQYKLEKDDYFEGHFHGEIRLDRDVETLKIRKKAVASVNAARMLKAAVVFSKKTRTKVEWV